MKNKEKVALIYRIIIVIVTAIALILNFKLLTFRLGILYFTNLSNLLVLIYFAILVIQMLRGKQKNNDIHYIFKGMTTMCITLTMCVYYFVLAQGADGFKGHMLECNLVHLVVPLLVIFDYLIFEEKGKMKKTYPFYWLIPLLCYECFVYFYSFIGGRFINDALVPYFFMDIYKYGILEVLISSIIIIFSYLVFAFIIYFFDSKLFNRNKCK